MRIYIAGPLSPRGIRPDTKNGAIEYALNVRDMVRVATELIKGGHAPFCPGLDFLYFIGASYGNEPTEVEIKVQSLEWLEVSDAILMIGEWTQSEGAVVEFEYARLHKIKIYTSLEEILKENAE
jgi:hypothetical protein